MSGGGRQSRTTSTYTYDRVSLPLWKRYAEPTTSASSSRRLGRDSTARESAVDAVLRHYTHQAHHGPSEGGVPAFTRADA